MGCASSSQVGSLSGVINEKPYAVTLIGLPSVGKTSLLEYLVGEFVSFRSNSREKTTPRCTPTGSLSGKSLSAT